MIECPFCLGPIPVESIACKNCGRNLADHIYILRRIEEIQVRLSKLDGNVREFVADKDDKLHKSPSRRATEPLNPLSKDLLAFSIYPEILLTISHYIIVIYLNLTPIWLFLATLFIPLPFGVMAVAKSHRDLIFWAILFFITSTLSVIAMNIVTGIAEGAPYFPTNASEWIHIAQFSCSIYFSFLSGALVYVAFIKFKHPHHPKNKMFNYNIISTKRIIRYVISERSVELFNKYVTAIGAMGSIVGAIYFGLNKL